MLLYVILGFRGAASDTLHVPEYWIALERFPPTTELMYEYPLYKEPYDTLKVETPAGRSVEMPSFSTPYT